MMMFMYLYVNVIFFSHRRRFGHEHLVGGIFRLHANAVLRRCAGCCGRGLLLLVHSARRPYRFGIWPGRMTTTFRVWRAGRVCAGTPTATVSRRLWLWQQRSTATGLWRLTHSGRVRWKKSGKKNETERENGRFPSQPPPSACAQPVLQCHSGRASSHERFRSRFLHVYVNKYILYVYDKQMQFNADFGFFII